MVTGAASGAAEHSVSAKGSLTLTYINGGSVRWRGSPGVPVALLWRAVRASCGLDADA
jgi:hypothetical protein